MAVFICGFIFRSKRQADLSTWDSFTNMFSFLWKRPALYELQPIIFNIPPENKMSTVHVVQSLANILGDNFGGVSAQTSFNVSSEEKHGSVSVNQLHKGTTTHNHTVGEEDGVHFATVTRQNIHEVVQVAKPEQDLASNEIKARRRRSTEDKPRTKRTTFIVTNLRSLPGLPGFIIVDEEDKYLKQLVSKVMTSLPENRNGFSNLNDLFLNVRPSSSLELTSKVTSELFDKNALEFSNMRELMLPTREHTNEVYQENSGISTADAPLFNALMSPLQKLLNMFNSPAVQDANKGRTIFVEAPKVNNFAPGEIKSFSISDDNGIKFVNVIEQMVPLHEHSKQVYQDDTIGQNGGSSQTVPSPGVNEVSFRNIVEQMTPLFEAIKEVYQDSDKAPVAENVGNVPQVDKQLLPTKEPSVEVYQENEQPTPDNQNFVNSEFQVDDQQLPTFQPSSETYQEDEGELPKSGNVAPLEQKLPGHDSSLGMFQGDDVKSIEGTTETLKVPETSTFPGLRAEYDELPPKLDMKQQFDERQGRKLFNDPNEEKNADLNPR